MEVSGESTLPVAVIGAGVTGLAAAFRLAQRGRAVRVLEASSRVGGVIQSERTPEGWQTESGPHTLLLNDPGVRRLIDELGLTRDILPAAPEAKHRYILRRGKPVAAPSSPPALLGSPLFSPGTKLRVLAEMFRRPRARSADMSLASLVEEHFGSEFVDYALQPFVSGVYAGDATRLSARHAFPRVWQDDQTCGSLIRGMMRSAKERRHRGEPRPQLISFAQGLQVIPDALARSLPAGSLQFGARAEQVVRVGDDWQVNGQRDGSPFFEKFSQVIFALPARALERIQIGTPPEPAIAELAGMQHSPITVLSLGFRREDVAHPLDGFGILIPACENRRILGVIFVSSLFPGRAPSGHVALTVMIGGSRQSSLCALPQDEIQSLAKTELRQLLGITGRPVFSRQRTWPAAIPQYNIGFERFKDLISNIESRHPGLHVAGPVHEGISVPLALLSGLGAAAKCLDGTTLE
ncbi:MAG: protoporphyrinogen oxidase [Opitutaceae bacterium]|nr:protoporphyrinogen oxidase [Opitutaceae bacterium]